MTIRDPLEEKYGPRLTATATISSDASRRHYEQLAQDFNQTTPAWGDSYTFTRHPVPHTDPKAPMWFDEYASLPVGRVAFGPSESTAAPTQVGGSHYAKLAIDPYRYAMENKLDALQFNAIKYVTRFREKNGIEDLRKAIHTIERLIAHEESK